MHYLLSLPPLLAEKFIDIEHADSQQWFCATDPQGRKVGSGGGTAWILRQWLAAGNDRSISQKKILIHAGGRSRRIPAYAPLGKVLTPMPVFRWARGQRLDQTLLTLQLPLYEKIMEQAPESLTTLIACGDMLVRAERPLQPIPEADVVCYGLWVDPQLATRHGVFVSSQSTPNVLHSVLQKPSRQQLEDLSKTHLFLMDIGIWLLSDKAIEVLSRRSTDANGEVTFYDLYSQFGGALGTNPTIIDPEVNALSVAILPLPGGEFYHYGTSEELLSSTATIQNKVVDQRLIFHRRIKPNETLFTQNSLVTTPLSSAHSNIWIENSNVGEGWQLQSRHIITGVPVNQWQLKLDEGICMDVVPVGTSSWAIRPYGFRDTMKDPLAEAMWMEKPFTVWASEHDVTLDMAGGASTDIGEAPLFPVVNSMQEMHDVLRWMLCATDAPEGRQIWLNAKRLSADEVMDSVNLSRIYEQRLAFRRDNWQHLADNHEKSVFYQLDLDDVARNFVSLGLPMPPLIDADLAPMRRIRNLSLRSRIADISGCDPALAADEQQQAFTVLRESMLDVERRQCSTPRLNVFPDQIVWGRSPVRIDLAGGWTDTPPYSLTNGGNVVNIAIELNGQPPLQVYVKPCHERHIVLRSIDMSAAEVVHTFDELAEFHKVGSPFSIPKAALALAGFLPAFCCEHYTTLEQQLEAFGSGIELTLLSAIPAGSGLGTSSILAATVLGALSDFCKLGWDNNEICRRALSLEQLLTTGGGWQDQYGGILQQVKLLQTTAGFDQQPVISWLPTQIFTAPDYKQCHLLYYTGITRTAKHILAEIVRGMFLNIGQELQLLEEMKHHALDMAEAIQRADFSAYGRLVAKTWKQNKLLDRGTNPDAVERIISLIEPYILGCKLPGAGGGGYLYMVAKDPQAAASIRHILTHNAPNPRARFVEMSISDTGFQCSRS